jgi:hypothetical protein
MQRTPLDILKEQNQIKKRKRGRNLLAVLQDLNEENRKQRQRDKLLDFHRRPLKQKHHKPI